MRLSDIFLGIAFGVFVLAETDSAQSDTIRMSSQSSGIGASVTVTFRPVARPRSGGGSDAIGDLISIAQADQEASNVAPVRSFKPRPRPYLATQRITTKVASTTTVTTKTRTGTSQSVESVSRQQSRLQRLLLGKSGKKTAGVVATTATILKTKRKAKKAAFSRGKGRLCGVKGIEGRAVPAVRGAINGCGIPNAVKVTAVDGIPIGKEALLSCEAAIALNDWVRNQARPTIGRNGGGLAKIKVIAAYSCRTRNSKKGAKLSEHAKGKGIDIAGFTLKNGTEITVLKDWRRGKYSRTMKALHKSACGPFGTVLGPNSDRHHQDHFHFDTANHRSGAYCR